MLASTCFDPSKLRTTHFATYLGSHWREAWRFVFAHNIEGSSMSSVYKLISVYFRLIECILVEMFYFILLNLVFLALCKIVDASYFIYLPSCPMLQSTSIVPTVGFAYILPQNTLFA